MEILAENSWHKILYKDSKYFYFAGTYIRACVASEPQDTIPDARTEYSIFFFKY